MSASNLSFRDLQCLVAIADNGSFSKAADACAITQPALSERVKRVESQLDVVLFERNKRGLKITAAGQSILGKARLLLEGIGELDEILAAATAPLSGPLRVGIINTLGPYLVPHLLPRMRREYPALELILHEGLTDALLASLQAGALDLAIAAAPLSEPGISQMPLFHEPFCLALPKHHPLAGSATVNAADLNGEDMVLLEEGHCLSGQALDVCPAKRRSKRERLHATSLETLRHMVAAGAGYTLLPWLAVGKKPPLRELVRYRALGGKRQYGRTVVLAWRTSFTRDRDIALFGQLVRECLPEGVQTLEG